MASGNPPPPSFPRRRESIPSMARHHVPSSSPSRRPPRPMASGNPPPPSFPRRRESIPGMVRHHDPGSSPVTPAFPTNGFRESPTSVIPATAGIHPQHGASSRPQQQSVTQAFPIRWLPGIPHLRHSSPTSVIPATAGIYPRHGAPSRCRSVRHRARPSIRAGEAAAHIGVNGS